MNFCVDNNFDILLTIDKNLMHQQNLGMFPLTIVILDCKTSKLEELVTFIPSFKSQLSSTQKSKAYMITNI